MKQQIKLTLIGGLLVSSLNLRAQEQGLSSKELVNKVLSGNRNLQISRIENNKAVNNLETARSLFKPTVMATGQYLFFAERPVIFLREGSANPKVTDVEVGGRNSLAAAITANYPIINPVLKNSVNKAGFEAALQKEKTADAEKGLVLQALQIYWTTVLYQEQKALLQQSLLRNEQALKDSRALLLQGKGLKTDTLRNYIATQNLQAGISSLQSQIDVQLLQLKQLTGAKEDQQFRLTSRLQETEDLLLPVGDSLKQLAFNNREDVRMQKLMVEDNVMRLKTARADFKPQLSAIAQYGVQAQSDKVAFWDYGYPRTSFVGLQLAIPVYSGGRARLKSAQVNNELEQSRIALEELKAKTNTELETIQATLAEAHRQHTIQSKNVEAAQVNYEMMKDRYQYGLSNRLELTDAELALTQAKINLLETLYTIKMTELQLQKAAGMLLPNK